MIMEPSLAGLPEHSDVPLWLVVVRGLGEKPMMMLPTISVSLEDYPSGSP